MKQIKGSTHKFLHESFIKKHICETVCGFVYLYVCVCACVVGSIKGKNLNLKKKSEDDDEGLPSNSAMISETECFKIKASDGF